jgi:hypothetical protein
MCQNRLMVGTSTGFPFGVAASSLLPDELHGYRPAAPEASGLSTNHSEPSVTEAAI